MTPAPCHRLGQSAGWLFSLLGFGLWRSYALIIP